jgi:hypothetical protein
MVWITHVKHEANFPIAETRQLTPPVESWGASQLSNVRRGALLPQNETWCLPVHPRFSVPRNHTLGNACRGVTSNRPHFGQRPTTNWTALPANPNRRACDTSWTSQALSAHFSACGERADADGRVRDLPFSAPSRGVAGASPAMQAILPINEPLAACQSRSPQGDERGNAVPWRKRHKLCRSGVIQSYGTRTGWLQRRAVAFGGPRSFLTASRR